MDHDPVAAGQLRRDNRPACDFSLATVTGMERFQRSWPSKALLLICSVYRCPVVMTERDLLERLIDRWHARQEFHGPDSPAARKAAEMIPILEARKAAMK